MTGRHRYQSFIMDSARWDGFELRDGDIVVTTPSKCGTTWMQMCCLVLVHGPELPASLSDLAPWLDQTLHPVAEIHVRLAAQDHRRVIKTHTPLDGIPWDERVTYVAVGRDPRDVALSLASHRGNMNVEAAQQLRSVASPDAPAALTLGDRPSEAAESFDHFVAEDTAVENFRAGLNSLVHHLGQVWERRDGPNVALFHYSDLRRDLDGELRRLAAHLGIDVDDEDVPALVEAATFESMKARADDLAPNAGIGLWHDNSRFFAEGRHGAWRDVVSATSLDAYDERLRRLTTDEAFIAWLHDGRLGAAVA